MSEFKTRFRELRKALAITLKEMSEDIGIPLSSISKYEQGIIKPGVDILCRLANCYNVNLNWLIANQGLMFEEKDCYAATGTDSSIRLRLVRYNNCTKIHSLTNDQLGSPKEFKLSLVEKPEDSIKNMSKEMNRPVSVEFSNTEEDGIIKVFYPDGKISIFNKDVDSFRSVLIKRVKSKLDSLPYDSNKLEFLDVALTALSNKDAFVELKSLVKGMDIALN